MQSRSDKWTCCDVVWLGLVLLPNFVIELCRCLYWAYLGKCPDCRTVLVETEDSFVCPNCEEYCR